MNVKGTTLYVNMTGSDGAYTSIQDAINAASDGDTVYIYNGAYDENIRIEKTINLTGEDINSTIIYDLGGTDIIHIDAHWVNISNLAINRNSTTGSGAGISIHNSHKCSVENVSINHTMYGIKTPGSNKSIIKGVSLTNNDNGIWIVDSADSVISDCLGLNNTVAIYLVTSYNVTLINNKMISDGIKVSGTKPSDYGSHNIDTTNTVNGKPIYYWRDKNNKTVPTGAGQVIIANCTDIVIEKQNITDVSWAISIYFSANIHIRNNSASYNSKNGLDLSRTNDSFVDNNHFISNNDIGISLAYANNNTITNNTIESSRSMGINVFWSHYNKIIANNISYNSDFGIRITQLSSNNYYYHNNFISNTEQINELADDKYFNDSYPSGGNYWSDYTGVDNFRGPGQNIPGGDGIGDISYPIYSAEEDNYPLMEPYYPISENSIILLEGWNFVSIPFIQQEQDLNNVLETIDSRYEAVQWYDNSNANDPWKHHKVGKPFGNDLHELNETKSFWIYISAPGRTTFVYNGTQPTQNQTISLYPGWNMVGYPSLTSYRRSSGCDMVL
jgi:parallel beta-helix repeat protein